MLRQLMIAILFCSLFVSTASVGQGQDYLDLPENEPTLTDRFNSFKDKFRGPQPQQSRQPEIQMQRRSHPRPPRYNKSRSQSHRKLSASVRPSSRPPAVTKVPSRSSSKSKALPQSAKTKSVKLDAKTQYVKVPSRSRKPSERQQLILGAKPQRSVTATRLPARRSPAGRPSAQAASVPNASAQVSSVKKYPASQRIARKSPATSRKSELDAALADLLRTQPAGQSTPASFSLDNPLQPTKRALRSPPVSSSSLLGNTFDLRKALLDDEEDSLAAEVAKAVEKSEQAATKAKLPAFAKPVVKESLVKKAEAKVAVTVKQAPPIPTAIMSPGALTPLAIKSSKPAAATTAAIITPQVTDSEAGFAMPRQSIVIATPAPQEAPSQGMKFLNSIRTEQGNDPFESTAQEQAFTSSPITSAPITSNPMRSAPSFETSPASSVIKRQAAQSFLGAHHKVLQTSQQPVIISRVEGPRTILVGREATYQITLENTSSTVAKDLRAEINVPEWAELVDAMSTSGVVEQGSQGKKTGALAWNLSKLAPKSTQSLRLRLIPHSGRPLQLGVRWSQAPVHVQAVVEVQEPKLELAISGPQEVRYGKPQRYRLTLRNPGTGLTEAVVLRLIPPGGDAESAVTQKIGNLKPGEVRDIDLELTAREAGELLIQANAIADGGLKTKAIKTVLCRKPELKVDWRGPDKKYAGTVAAYYFRVRNPGTAPTEPVDLSVKLPTGAEFVSASEGFSINKSTGVIGWRLASIKVGEEQFIQVRCKIARPGLNDFQLIAKTIDGELKDSKKFHTEVIALADLKLEVTDPQGPLPMGESVIYEIRVRNRGTTRAENINIVGLFSEGIDPTTIEGAQFTLRDGRVSFHPIKNLPAGREIVLRIHAKANQVGTHIFRTEVTCPELDIKLAAEETTRFFEDEHRWEDGETPYSAERQQEASRR